MAVMLLTPFTQVSRRSVQVASGVLPVSGRWISTNATGLAALPAAGSPNVSLVIEGLRAASVEATFDGSNVPSAFASFSSAVAANAIAVAYGVFRFEVGPEGFATEVETALPGTALYVDAAGVLVSTPPAGTPVAVALVETASTTKLVARSLATA
jgi:hypothetical protein